LTEEIAKKLFELREEQHFTFEKIAEIMGYSSRERARQNCIKAFRIRRFMDEETKGALRSINERLQEIAVILHRIEDRQIAVREEIKDQAPPIVGSFASSE
jgi:transcriptional regulator with XRE-family HTH domain